MFFKSLKQRSAQKVLESNLARRAGENQFDKNPIKNVGCIIDEKHASRIEPLKRYFSDLGIHPNNVHFLIHTEVRDMAGEMYSVHFHREDFGWKGKVNNESLREFLSKPHHLLVNYYADDGIWASKLASSMCKNDLSAGFASIDERMNDIVIDCRPEDQAVFQEELKKYLKVLKKL